MIVVVVVTVVAASVGFWFMLEKWNTRNEIEHQFSEEPVSSPSYNFEVAKLTCSETLAKESWRTLGNACLGNYGKIKNSPHSYLSISSGVQ